MVESMLGVFLVVIAVAAGYLCGKSERRVRREKPTPPAAFGWQELLNFLQYDGSGEPQNERAERRGTDEK